MEESLKEAIDNAKGASAFLFAHDAPDIFIQAVETLIRAATERDQLRQALKSQDEANDILASENDALRQTIEKAKAAKLDLSAFLLGETLMRENAELRQKYEDADFAARNWCATAQAAGKEVHLLRERLDGLDTAYKAEKEWRLLAEAEIKGLRAELKELKTRKATP